MAVLTPEQFATLRSDIWFSTLPAELAGWLIEHGHIRKLSHGQYLFFRGDAADGIYGVLGGALRVFGVTADGKEALLQLVEPPVWFGEIALFDGLPRTHDVQADGGVTLLQVSQTVLHDLLRQQPAYWQHFGVLMSFKLRLVFINQESQTLMPPEGMLARRLFWMLRSSPAGAQSGPARLKVKQSTLAQMLAMSRQTVNRIMMELQQRGVVRVSYGTVEVIDPEALADAAQLNAMERKMLQIINGRSGNP